MGSRKVGKTVRKVCDFHAERGQHDLCLYGPGGKKKRSQPKTGRKATAAPSVPWVPDFTTYAKATFVAADALLDHLDRCSVCFMGEYCTRGRTIRADFRSTRYSALKILRKTQRDTLTLARRKP